MPEKIPMQRVIQKLDEYYSKNDTAGAIRHLNYWAQEAELCGDYRALITLYNEKMGFYRKAGKKDEAFLSAESADNLIERLKLTDTISAATVYVNCATVYTAFDCPEKSIPYFLKAERIYKDLSDEYDDKKAGLYNNMSLAYLGLNQYECAEKYCLSAIEIMKQIKGGEPEQAISLLNLANIFEAKLGLEEGWGKIEECIENASKLLSLPHLEENGNLAFVFSKCAPTFDYYGYFSFANELKERSKEIYERS